MEQKIQTICAVVVAVTVLFSAGWFFASKYDTIIVQVNNNQNQINQIVDFINKANEKPVTK